MKRHLKLRQLSLALLFFLFCSMSIHAQEQLVTIKLQNASLSDVFKVLEKQTSYRFSYRDVVISPQKDITITKTKATVATVLDEILATRNLDYSIISSKSIVISDKKLSQTSTSSNAKSITGTVQDPNGEPIIGASVTIKGTTNGTITDIDGKFSLDIPGDGTLIVSYIGYISQSIKISARSIYDIVLEEDTKILNEVVVVGYGTQKKVTLTGSVAAVKGDDLAKSPAVNMTSSLAGRLPGVIINTRTGEPGNESISLNIRGIGTIGETAPLVIIDGVERAGLGQLNPNDIESVSVLKDAEGAIYGAKAANGVILVTTKRGKDGKPSINFSHNQGFSQPVRSPKMADAYTFASIANEMKRNEHNDPNSAPILPYSADELEKYRNGSDPNYPNTNWYDYMTRTLTPLSRTNVSVSGGSKKANYFLSLGMLNQEGQYRNGSQEYKQYSFRSNVDVQVTDNLKVGFNLGGRYDDKHSPKENPEEISSHLFLYYPTWQTYWPGTDYLQPLRDGENVMNWVGDNAGYNINTTKSFTGTFFFDWDLPWIKGLTLSGNATHDAGYIFTKAFAQPAYVYANNNGDYEKIRSGRTPSKASVRDASTFSNKTYLMGRASYKHSFNLHNLNLLGGYEQTKTNGNYLMASRSDFISPSLPQINQGSVEKDKQSNDGYANQYAAQNIFGRVNYDYAGKYMAQATLRIDGSTNFPEDSRFGYFPSFSAGWRISEEKFMENIDFVDNLKVRASWGMSGNDQVAAYQYLATYSYGSRYVIGNTEVQGLNQGVMPNPNITWETSKTWNWGLESTLWNGLLGVELDVFRSMRSDILTQRKVTVPWYTGLNLPNENFGKVRNQGFELALSHSNQKNQLKYTLTGNLNYAKNKVIDIDEAPAAEPYQQQTGRPYGSELYYNAIGIFKDQNEINNYPHLAGTQPGDIKYADTNGDKIIDSRDRILVEENAMPQITFGLNAFLEYKNFDLSILFQGQEKAKVNLGGGYGFFSVLDPVSFGNFLEWRADGRWEPDADNNNARMPRARSGTSNNNTEQSTQWLLDAGFLRLKNLELGYNLPTTLCQKIGAQGLRFSFSASNLWLVYDHLKDLGFDPETTAYWYYPQQRTYNIGVNLTF